MDNKKDTYPDSRHQYQSKELDPTLAAMHPSSLQQSYTGKHFRRNVTAQSCSSSKEIAAREAKELADIDKQIQECQDKYCKLQQIHDAQPTQSAILQHKSLMQERDIAFKELNAKQIDGGDKGGKDTQSAQTKAYESGRRGEGGKSDVQVQGA
ncbi:uncharacterized protein AB675_8534 [Cyphellophora attinorum]|uniref:Uncharacterized protein n=1 Tax=Cyphellophora attinorum TaxID=1664694 RepID=A0A0N0NR65_9EURO|nr:uncharacterized protein AB675_8534 [Phialophora attinorum]KPI44728.1 hypothetical protein AB675_8534 [Phialophora attinorum]